MPYYLFVAEKPSVMKEVKSTYEKHYDELRERIGLIDFVALSGHVCCYYEPDQYDAWKGKKWREIPLPMIPGQFKVGKLPDPRAARIVEDIRTRMKPGKYDGIIVGTDSDTEGNGIYYLISEYLHLEKIPTMRFFETSMTEKDILRSLNSLTDFYRNPRDVNMTRHYIARSQFDWLVGMNATRAATLRLGDLYRIGRVKAPTIKLVYDNCAAIDGFTPSTVFQVKVIYEAGFSGILVDENREPVSWEKKEDALKKLNNLMAYPKIAKITSLERKKTATAAPQLYTLTAIQKEAGKELKLNPEKTMETIESLYLKHLVSYPRTEGAYISSAKAESFPELLETVSKIPRFADTVSKVTPADISRTARDPRVVNDEKLKGASHDALLPTEKHADYGKLSPSEIQVYEMICKRFLAQFLPKKTEEKTILFAKIGDTCFKSAGTTVLDSGWTVLYPAKRSGEEIPAGLASEDTLNVKEYSIHEKTSKAPERFTTASLVGAMENISRYIEDKDLKKVMSEAKGLGTPATRSAIVSEIAKTGYIRLEGKEEKIFITDKGKSYVEALSGFSILDPAAAAGWEELFQQVRKGEMPLESAQDKTLAYVRTFVKEISGIDAAPAAQARPENILPDCSCPYCGGTVRVLPWGYACENSRTKSCRFAVNGFDGKIKAKDAVRLINKGSTNLIKGIGKSTKDGKPYDAYLILNPKGSAYVTALKFPEKSSQRR